MIDFIDFKSAFDANECCVHITYTDKFCQLCSVLEELKYVQWDKKSRPRSLEKWAFDARDQGFPFMLICGNPANQRITASRAPQNYKLCAEDIDLGTGSENIISEANVLLFDVAAP